MQQCMELTSTNRSRAYPTDFEYGAQAKVHKSHRKHMLLLETLRRFTTFISSFQGSNLEKLKYILSICSLIAQLVEHSTVNRVVTGSSPVRGAMERCPSWPKEHDWKSCRRQKRLEGSNPSLSATIFIAWPVGQGVKTPPFHGGNRGSNPLRVTNNFLKKSLTLKFRTW